VIILGIDPGSLRTGWGAIATDGRRHRLLEAGILAPPSRAPLPERLRQLHAGVAALIARLRPEALAVEDIFHAANTRSALVLGHVRGVILLAGGEARLPVLAFAPATVKAEISGYGQAAKSQVAFMVARHLALAEAPAADAADALAIALCAANRRHQLGVAAPARQRRA
jgi:crossover junction endodeoxyribonuclease RuvC